MDIGTYQGFGMELSFSQKEYYVTLKGASCHDVKLGYDVHGNLSRINDALEGLEQELSNCKENLVNIKKQLERAKAEMERPFPEEEQLREKVSRLNEVNVMLSLDSGEEVSQNINYDEVSRIDSEIDQIDAQLYDLNGDDLEI